MREYPNEVVPKATYKKQLVFKALKSDYPNMLVLRMVRGQKEDYYDDSSDVQELTDRIFQGTIQNLSMNLLGGKFKIEHHSFRPKNDGASDEWNGGDVNLSKYRNSYIDEIPSFYVCFNVDDIDGTTYPFPVKFNNQEERDAMEEKAKSILVEREVQIDQDVVDKFVSSENKVNVQVLMQLVHRPNNLNYWHVTLDTTRPDNSEYIMPDEKLNSRDKRQMKAFKQHLMELIIHVNTVPYKFRRKDYVENVSWWDKILDAFGK